MERERSSENRSSWRDLDLSLRAGILGSQEIRYSPMGMPPTLVSGTVMTGR